nr:SDR family NAD(P)-dependent oxidoreductase [Mesorhizobium albiziae]
MGGSKGLGLALAKRLAAEGAALLIGGRNQDDLDAAANVLRSKSCVRWRPYHTSRSFRARPSGPAFWAASIVSS